MRRPILLLAGLPLAMLPLVMLLLNAAVWPSAGQAADATRPAKTGRLTAEEQQSALEFVKEHHPQLNTLITRLKKRDPAEYHKALHDVFKTSERLHRLQYRDRPRHDVELKLWKVGSRIRLLAARMATDRSPELASQLRELLNERTDLRLQQLTLERERLKNRLERIEGQVNQLSGERDAVVDKEIERLRRTVRAGSSRVSKKSARKAPANAGTTDQSNRRPEPPRKNRLPERPAEKPSN